jgi:hypothetical protein
VTEASAIELVVQATGCEPTVQEAAKAVLRLRGNWARRVVEATGAAFADARAATELVVYRGTTSEVIL